METAAVYSGLVGLCIWAWGRSDGALVPALAANFAATAAVGHVVTDVPAQDVCMIMADLMLVYVLRFACQGWRAYVVGLIVLAGMIWRTVHIGGAPVGGWIYAATLNAAFAAQLLIAGGVGDVVGGWLGHRAGRLLPRFAGLFRHGAG